MKPLTYISSFFKRTFSRKCKRKSRKSRMRRIKRTRTKNKIKGG